MAEQITVTLDDLEKTFRVWVNTAPRRMWQDYFRCSETTYKWGGGADPFDRFDPRHAFARFLAEKFKQAGWTVTYEQERPHGWGPEPKESGPGSLPPGPETGRT